MEPYVSDKGTWVIVMSFANGISRIPAAVRDWEDLAVRPAGQTFAYQMRSVLILCPFNRAGQEGRHVR